MAHNHPDRLDSAQLDADISVLGEGGSSEPQIGRVGGAPTHPTNEGLRQDVLPEGAAPRENEEADGFDQFRIASEVRREVVDRYGKG